MATSDLANGDKHQSHKVSVNAPPQYEKQGLGDQAGQAANHITHFQFPAMVEMNGWSQIKAPMQGGDRLPVMR